MSSRDELKFHDSGSPDDVLFDQSDGHTHTFTNFPASAVDDEEDEGGDKSQLIADGEKKPPSFWTFEYYQQFFDVETRQVFHRVAGSMLPLPHKNYLQQHIRPNPDLYGPFWICTTLVFTTAIAGNLANYMASGGQDYHWKYDFHKVTFAATAIFSYWWVIPALLYGVLWWRKSEAGYTFMEILCVYGYSLAIYIPISILWVVNITWFKWALVVVGAVLSGGVLVLTFWPAIKQDTKKVAAIFVGVIFILHLALAAGFVLYFFHIPPAAQTGMKTTTVAPTQPPQKHNQEKPVHPSSLQQKADKTNPKPGDATEAKGIPSTRTKTKPSKTVESDPTGNDQSKLTGSDKTAEKIGTADKQEPEKVKVPVQNREVSNKETHKTKLSEALLPQP